jgi:hypothetical protein
MSRVSFSLSFLLSLALFGVSPALAQGFFDVPKEHTYFDAIEYVKSNGIVQGYSDGTFKPDNTINRAEFLKILIEAQFKDSSDVESCTGQSFHDVPTNEWYSKYACFAKSQGIIKGYSDGSFKPNQTISFAEAAKIVVNTMIGKTEEGVGRSWETPFVTELDERGITPYLPNCKSSFYEWGEEIPQECDYQQSLITRGFMVNMIYTLKYVWLTHENWEWQIYSNKNLGFELQYPKNIYNEEVNNDFTHSIFLLIKNDGAHSYDLIIQKWDSEDELNNAYPIATRKSNENPFGINIFFYKKDNYIISLLNNNNRADIDEIIKTFKFK